jgi:CubicO group peptidase (beta-lactamase class C family)
VRQLLTHYAALPAGIPTRAWSGTEGALDAIVALKPLAPAGSRFVYSDVDFIVLGELVRRVSGQTLEAYAAANIFRPLGMRDTGFQPPATLKNRIAPADIERGELRWGEVQTRSLFAWAASRVMPAVHHGRRPHAVRTHDGVGRQ